MKENLLKNKISFFRIPHTCGLFIYISLSFIILNFPTLNLYGQNTGDKTVSLNVINEPITIFLSKFTARTGITFLYSDELLQNIRVNCSVNNALPEDILKNVLSEHGLGYKRTSNNQIVIYKKPEKPTYTIAGVIKDIKSGETLPYTHILIEETKTGTTANTEGHFLLQKIDEKRFSISFYRIGYFKKTISVNIDSLLSAEKKSNIPFLTIGLEEHDIIFSPLVINADYEDIFKISDLASSFSMSPRNQSVMPVIGDKDISRSLQTIAGIGTSSFGSSGLNIRGGIPSQNLILMDGIVLYHMNHSFGFFNAFNPDAIKDIQIYKGGYPAVFGGRLAGVVELTSKDGDFFHPHLSVGVNQMNGKVQAEIPLFGHGSALVSFRRSFSDFVLGSLYDRVFNSFKENITMYESQLQRSSNLEHSIYFNDLLGKITFMPDNDDIITLSYFSSLDKLESGGPQKRMKVRLVETSNTKNIGYSLNWYRKWNSDINTRLILSHSDYASDSRKTWNNLVITDTVLINKIGTLNELKDYSVRIDNQWDVHPSHKLEFGLLFSRLSTIFDFDLEYLPDLNLSSKGNNNTDNADEWSYYVQDTWKINSRLTSVAGIRINKYQLSDNVHFEPRISLNYKLSDEVLLKGAWGKYYQYIMQYEDFSNMLQGRVSWIPADGKNINPSSSYHYILGAKFENPDYLLDAEAYIKNSRNVPQALLEWQLTERSYQGSSVSQSGMKNRGFDILLKKKTGLLTGWISYGYCKSVSSYENNGRIYESPSSTDIPHKFDVVANIKMGNFTFSAVWHWISGQPYSTPVIVEKEYDGTKYKTFADPDVFNNNRFPSSHQMDLTLAYSLSTSLLNIFGGISVFNVYDQQNIWYRFANIKNNELILSDVYMLGFTPTFFCEIQF